MEAEEAILGSDQLDFKAKGKSKINKTK